VQLKFVAQEKIKQYKMHLRLSLQRGAIMFLKKLFPKSIEHECLANVMQLPDDCIAVIASFLCINEIFQMRYVSPRMHGIIHGSAMRFICHEPWRKFILEQFPQYKIDKEDHNNPLRQYLNYRSLPKYAKNSKQRNILIKTIKKNHYPSIKFVLKHENVEQRGYLACDAKIKVTSFFGCAYLSLIGNYTYGNCTPLFVNLYLMPFYTKAEPQIKILQLLLQFGARYDAQVTEGHSHAVPGTWINIEAYTKHPTQIDAMLHRTSKAKRALIYIAKAEDALRRGERNLVIIKHLEKACQTHTKTFDNYINNLSNSGKSVRLLKEKELQQIIHVADEVKNTKKNEKPTSCSLM